MTPPVSGNKFRSYVPDKTEMREFTTRAVLLGLVMTVVLGAANLYLGLRAGMTDRKSTRLNSSHLGISYAVFCLKKKKGNHVVGPSYPAGTPLWRVPGDKPWS